MMIKDFFINVSRTQRSQNIWVRVAIVVIVAVIVAIYYLTQLRAFPYEGYDLNVNRLGRFDAELNASLVQTRFGSLKNYDPIDKSVTGINEAIANFEEELLKHPDPRIVEKLRVLKEAVERKQDLTQRFKRTNPILINAISQFSSILALIIESEASVLLVESCLSGQQIDQSQLIDAANRLFRGILIYVSQRGEEQHKALVSVVKEVRSLAQPGVLNEAKNLPRLMLSLQYADKILELQPILSQIDEELFAVPIIPSLNALHQMYGKVRNEFDENNDRLRIILYLLLFVLLVVLRWAFTRLQNTVNILHDEVQQKILAQNELAQINRELEQRVADRTRELTIKNHDLNEALADLKEAQEQLIIQEKMASVGMLTTGIAHEIKNPLNFVNNFSDISIELVSELKEELEANKEALKPESLTVIEDIITDLKTNCSKIKEHGVRADNIVKNMLMHSQEAGVEKEWVDVKQLMEDNIQIALESFRDKHGKFDVQIDKEFDENFPKILAVPQALSRVFIYVIDNSLYAMREKQMKAGAEYEPILKITMHVQDPNVVIKIWDNGTGIPKKSLDKIFEPFFTTKPTGKGNTGLGLSICYDTVVKQHKGELRAASEEEVFTEITIVLPLMVKKGT